MLFLVSSVLTGLVVLAGYQSPPTAILLATFFGYILSQDLLLFFNTPWKLIKTKFAKTPKNTSPHLWRKFVIYILKQSVKGITLLPFSFIFAYFSFTANESAKTVASIVFGVFVILVAVCLQVASISQGIYILGLVRNPLHPWELDNVQEFKAKRKRLASFGAKRLNCSYTFAIMLHYGKLNKAFTA